MATFASSGDASDVSDAPLTRTSRFVPLASSLTSDAPGWGHPSIPSPSTSSPSNPGPICWKCKGAGYTREKVKEKVKEKAKSGCEAPTRPKACTVCHQQTSTCSWTFVNHLLPDVGLLAGKP